MAGAVFWPRLTADRARRWVGGAECVVRTRPRSAGVTAERWDLARPQRRGKLAQTARPVDAKQTVGLWTPAALRDRLHVEQRLDLTDDVLGG